jgi:pimeloyl-ACP methyl ester carboxylesterase
MMIPWLVRHSKLTLQYLGVLVFGFCLSACGGGDSTAVAVQEPVLINAVGPGQFREAVKLRTLATSDIVSAIASGGTAVLSATPRYGVDAYRLTYLTLDGNGQEIVASALVAIPQKPGISASPVLSYQHATLAHEADAPSNLADLADPAIVVASLGYIVLAADYVGYGASKGASHPYLLAAPSASAVLDLLTAARYWRQTQHVIDNKQLFLAGYSEGAYVSMAAQRALQSASSSLQNQVVSVVVGAGPYDVGLTLDELLKLVRQSNPLIGALLNPGFLKYLSTADRNNVRNLLMRQLLGPDTDVTFMPVFLDNYLADDRASIEALSDVYDWLTQVPVNFFHGRDDRTVSYLNATTALQAMRARGSGNLVSLTDCTAQPAGHLECVQPYWRFMLDTFSTFAKNL